MTWLWVLPIACAVLALVVLVWLIKGLGTYWDIEEEGK